MSRLIKAFLLAVLTGVSLTQVQVPDIGAQDKAKAKNKKGTPATPPPTNPSDLKEDLSRVLPVFDPGSHTQPISAMGFSKDKTKLISVGQDFTVQVWNTQSGERLDILRLPGYGREKGYDPGRWDVAAVSPDGTRIAIGGEAKFLYDHEAKANAPARLLVVDLVKRRVMRVQLAGNTETVTSLTFSSDGETLAVGLGKKPQIDVHLFLVSGLSERIAKANPIIRTADCTFVKSTHKNAISKMAFSPDGKRFATAEDIGKQIILWNVPSGIAPVPTVHKAIEVDRFTTALAWSPDSKKFVHSFRITNNENRIRGFIERTADGDLVKKWTAENLAPAVEVPKFVSFFSLNYLDANSIYFVANGGTTASGNVNSGGTIAGILDLTTGKARKFGSHSEGMVTAPVGAMSHDGQLIAYTVTGNTEIKMGAVQGKELVHCGQRTPFPYYLGWSKDPAKPSIAWNFQKVASNREERNSSILKFGFDLSKIEPLGTIRSSDYDTTRWKHGEWSIRLPAMGKLANDAFIGRARLMKGDQDVVGLPIIPSKARTFIPNGDKPPLIAMAIHREFHSDSAQIMKSDGTVQNQLLPNSTQFNDMVPSPDGRFLAVSTGTPRVSVYRTDGTPYPLLSYAQLNGEWVCWTPEGYYAASPGGEKMFGWAINNGPNALVTFQPADQHSSKFRRPDIIKLAIEKGSVKEALAALKTVTPNVEAIHPPVVKAELLEQNGGKIKVRAIASSGSKEKPIQTMRIFLNGLVLQNGAGVWTAASNKPADAVFELDLPPGIHELKVMARNDDGSTISEPLVITGPMKPKGPQPTLYRICVGINDYDDAGWKKLRVAVKDAQDMFTALGNYCVGPDNLFGEAKGELILDKEATRERIIKALKDVRSKIKREDLLVFYFAGHGIQVESKSNGDNLFYLITREGPSDDTKLKGLSISENDLTDEFSESTCPVLMILDACHSAGAAKSFRPATAEASRKLTNANVGVILLSAAMAHEEAAATSENGHFTSALIKGLKVEHPIYDRYKRILNVNHLYLFASDEVRNITDGNQNPFLNIPPTFGKALPVRLVPAK